MYCERLIESEIKRKMMRKLLYCSCIILFTSCFIGSKSPQTIVTNLYESPSTDSLNQVLQRQNIAIRISTNEDDGVDTLFVGKYVIIEEKIGHSLWAITDMPDYYLLDIAEYLCGYNISLIYNKAHSTLYQTEEFDLNNNGYHVLYETCDFNDCTIEVKYEDESEEKVHFRKCVSDTIRL